MMKRRRIAWAVGGMSALAFCALIAISLRLLEPLPLEAASSSSRLVLDREGRLLRAFTTPDGRWRLDAKPDEVSATYLTLLLAFEDHRFWKHQGVDPMALARSVLQAVRHGRLISGGSTLTMQVARLLRGSPTHSITSKFQQIADALRLEATLSKIEIMALYLKLAPYGGNLEGVRAASLAYFGKEPHRLSIAEAALLVAIPQSPETRRLDRGDYDTDAQGSDKTTSSCPAPQGHIRACCEASSGGDGCTLAARSSGRGYRSLMEARNRVIQRAAAAHAIAPADAKTAMAQAAPRGRREVPSPGPHISQRPSAAVPD